MKNMNELLLNLPDGTKACKEAREWAWDKTWKEVYDTCHRGDWLLWLFAKVNPKDLQLLTLAKGHCANTVRNLMTDERSIAAVDAAIAFGEGKISRKELDDFAYAANDAAGVASDDAAIAAAVAAGAAADAAVAGAAADAAGAAVDAAAKKANQQKTADICKKYLPMEIWNIK